MWPKGGNDAKKFGFGMEGKGRTSKLTGGKKNQISGLESSKDGGGGDVR